MIRPEIQRRKSRGVTVGNVTIGAGAPVSIQSMTTTPTSDVAATLAQINALAGAGCDIVRVATPTADDTATLAEIVAAAPVPIVADVHFHFKRALEAVAAGAQKIRLNPGNIADRQAVRAVIDACKDSGVPIRVGVNEGSVIERVDSSRRRRQRATPIVELMVETIDSYLEVFAEAGFDDMVLSAKSRDVMTTIEVNRALARKYDWPLHLGLTHAGTARSGAVRSAAAISALLAEGIGDTIRVSLAGDPLAEVLLAKELLGVLGLRRLEGVEVIACPTCGRTNADVASLAGEVQEAMARVKEHVVVAVMGCVVNGPGEASQADVAACCGDGKAAIYRAGRYVRTVGFDGIVEALVTEAVEAVKDKG